MAQSASDFLEETSAKVPSADDFLGDDSADSFLDGPSPYAEVIAEAQANAARTNPLSQAIVDAANDPVGVGRAVYRPSTLGKMALRVGVPLTVGVGTGGLGLVPAMALTGAAGAISEAGAQGLEVAGGERDSLSGAQIGASGLLNTVPGLPLGRFASPVTRAGIRVAEGAGLGAAYPVLESGLRGELPQISDIGTGALFGAGIGLLPGGMELARGRTFGRAATALEPTELDIVGRTMREPVPTDIVPTELEAMRQAQAITAAETGAGLAAGERAVANLDAGIDAEKVRRLGERMAGKSPQDQLSILDQEMRLQKDTLTLAEQRAGLDAKIALKQQIDQQKALEAAARSEQEAIKQAQEGITPAEPPKSQQILQENAKPPALANVATEVATQTKQSPYALQGAVNKMTQVEAPQPAMAQVVEPGAAAPAEFVGIQEGIPGKIADMELFNLTADIPGHNAGSTVTRKTLEEAGYKVPEQAKAEVVSDQYSLKAPKPLNESLGTVKEALAYRQERIDNYKKVLKAEIGLSDEQVERLANLLSRGRDTGRFERTLTQQQRDKLEAFFEGPMNQRNGPLEQWDDSIPDIGEIASATDKEWLADKVVGSLGNIGNPPSFGPSDRFLSPVLALNRLKEIGGTWEDVFNQVLEKTRRMGAGNDSAELARAYSESIKRFADENGLALPLKTEAIGSRPTTPELRVNNASLGRKPISGMSRAEKRAELDAAGVTEYAGKPLDDINPAQLSAAVGKLRQGTLGGERGSIPTSAIAPIAGAGGGGIIGFTTTSREPGETDEEFQARRLRNAAIGAAYGAVGGAGLNALGKAARASAAAKASRQGGNVPLPEAAPGEGIRRTAEKVIVNKSYPEQLRTILAEDPEIVYEKISRNRIRDLTKGATDAELIEMTSSPDPNLRIGALIQQANRAAVTPGMEAEGARLMREVSKNFTSPAQLLGMGSLVESPQAMVQAVEDALNLPGTAKERLKTMTDGVKKKLLELSERNIRAEQRYARAERAARDNLSDATASELKAAELELGTSKKALADYTKDILPEDYGNIASKIIKGNLLGPLSFAKNMFGNVMWQSALRGAESVATGLDAVYSQATGRPRSIKLGVPWPSVDELKALGSGVRVAAGELLTGPSEQSYIKTEVQRGFHPLRAMVQVFEGIDAGPALKKLGLPTATQMAERLGAPVKPPALEDIMAARGIASLPRSATTGKVPVSDRAKKLIEATLGITPEASFRMLNLGDKPVRLVTEARLLAEAADLKGLTGEARAKFMALPDEATKARIEAEGRGGIMAQRNPLAQKVGKIFDSWMVDLAESLGMTEVPYLREFNKLTGTLQLPFREFPANFASNALNFAMPPVAMTRSIIQARNGNRREAMRNMGEAAMGMMFYAAADYLWEKGLISPPLDPRDKKRRQAQYEIGANRINVSGIERLKNGEDPKYRLGDTTRDWTIIGPPAAALYVYTRRRALEEAKASRTGDEVQIPKLTGAMLDASGAANFVFDQSFLAGTSAFIDALQDWETFGDRFTQNTFRAITAIPVPAAAESLAKTQYKFIPEMKGDSLTDTLKNVWDFKVMELPQNARSNLKRDMWGEPIQRTPEGSNPYLYQFLDVFRAETKPANPFKQALLSLYQQTHSTDVYPALVGSTLSLGGTTVELYADDEDDIKQLIGAYRRQFAEQVVNNPRFSAPDTLPEQKLLALKEAYTEGAKVGKQAFLMQDGPKARYPELYGLPSVPGKSRVIARDIKARGRLRMERDAEGTP